MEKRIYKIWCNEVKHGKHFKTYLGYLSLDDPGTAGFYCKNCKRHYEYTVTKSGVIMKKTIHFKAKIDDYDTLMVLERKHGDNKKVKR